MQWLSAREWMQRMCQTSQNLGIRTRVKVSCAGWVHWCCQKFLSHGSVPSISAGLRTRRPRQSASNVHAATRAIIAFTAGESLRAFIYWIWMVLELTWTCHQQMLLAWLASQNHRRSSCLSMMSGQSSHIICAGMDSQAQEVDTNGLMTCPQCASQTHIHCCQSLSLWMCSHQEIWVECLGIQMFSDPLQKPIEDAMVLLSSCGSPVDFMTP
mmetsp:Transcript_236/g.507  ORF Transcript_236/g.507 Transcript_236/m.507 type:complete len:212 (-) Transcript_236:123-758(-)